jgi:predicted PurR-regulated permease PerM
MTVSDYIQTYIVKNKFVAALLTILVLFIIYILRFIFIDIFIAYIIATSSLPLVGFLQRRKIARGVAAFIPIIGTIITLIVLLVPLTSLFVNQWQAILNNISIYFSSVPQLSPIASVSQQFINNNLDKIPQIGTTIFGITGSVFEGAFSIFLVLYLSYYLILDGKKLRLTFLHLFPSKQRRKIDKAEIIIQEKMGGWFRGQILISLIIGFMAWVLYTLIGLPYTIALASIAAILEILPNIGPVIAVIPALILALTISPTRLIYTLIAYVLIHAIEAYVLVPKIMEKSIGLHPLAIVLAIIAGSKLSGITGALLAVPFISFCTIIFDPRTWNEAKK